jgi:hypothetical protein
MASVVDFLHAQPPDVYQFVLRAIEPIWLDSKQMRNVAEAIKQKYPGRYSEDEIFHLIAGAMTIMR